MAEQPPAPLTLEERVTQLERHDLFHLKIATLCLGIKRALEDKEILDEVDLVAALKGLGAWKEDDEGWLRRQLDRLNKPPDDQGGR